jgi:RimJ/RimL family protein N-acetyltransferase
MPMPSEIQTPRLLLRPWRADDAMALLPVLEANRAHIGPWIPARVAQPVELPLLAQRLAGFGAAFDEDREWRFGMFARDDGRVLGEIDLFARNAEGRVALPESDRGELGYWLRSDATGQGLVLEGARAALAVAAELNRFGHVEIRCDLRNAPSVAVARRLGFSLADTIADDPIRDGDPPVTLQVWTSRLEPFTK